MLATEQVGDVGLRPIGLPLNSKYLCAYALMHDNSLVTVQIWVIWAATACSLIHWPPH